jgi:hypothetical protein
MPVDDIQRRRKSIRVDPRIGFEMLGYESAALDFVEKMPQWRRAEPMQMLDEARAPEPRAGLFLVKGGFWGRNSIVRSHPPMTIHERGRHERPCFVLRGAFTPPAGQKQTFVARQSCRAPMHRGRQAHKA